MFFVILSTLPQELSMANKKGISKSDDASVKKINVEVENLITTAKAELVQYRQNVTTVTGQQKVLVSLIKK